MASGAYTSRVCRASCRCSSSGACLAVRSRCNCTASRSTTSRGSSTTDSIMRRRLSAWAPDSPGPRDRLDVVGRASRLASFGKACARRTMSRGRWVCARSSVRCPPASRGANSAAPATVASGSSDATSSSTASPAAMAAAVAGSSVSTSASTCWRMPATSGERSSGRRRVVSMGARSLSRYHTPHARSP